MSNLCLHPSGKVRPLLAGKYILHLYARIRFKAPYLSRSMRAGWCWHTRFCQWCPANFIWARNLHFACVSFMPVIGALDRLGGKVNRLEGELPALLHS